MPLRASKMNGFIFGFQRLVWCPKWTPESNNSFTPILITIFLWLEVRPPPERAANHPAEHGIDFSVVVAPRAHWRRKLRPLSPFQWPAESSHSLRKEGNKITDSAAVATIIWEQSFPKPLA